MSNLIENKDYKILLTDELPEWVGGTCCFPIFPFFGIGTCTVKIKNKYKFDIGLLKHEIEHVKQYKNNWFHTLKYKFSNEYRLKSEIEAYCKQIEEYKYTSLEQVEWILTALVGKYNIKLKESIIREIAIKRFRKLLLENLVK